MPHFKSTCLKEAKGQAMTNHAAVTTTTTTTTLGPVQCDFEYLDS